MHMAQRNRFAGQADTKQESGRLDLTQYVFNVFYSICCTNQIPEKTAISC